MFSLVDSSKYQLFSRLFFVYSGPASDITAMALSYSGALEVKIVYQNPFVVIPSLFLPIS